MQRSIDFERFLKDLEKQVAADPRLQETLDGVDACETILGIDGKHEPRLEIPFVNAPFICGPKWQ